MVSKKVQIALIIIAFTVFAAAVYYSISITECKDLHDRQRRLNRIKDDVVIIDEITVDSYIISAVEYDGGKEGLAVFAPLKNGNHKFQSGHWKSDEDIIIDYLFVPNNKHDIIASLKRNDLVRAEIELKYDGKTDEKKINIQPGNMIVCVGHPETSGVTVNVVFYDINGNRYE